MKKPSISIVIPALNEKKNIKLAIENCLNALSDFEIDGEVLCVNDGSSDNTLEIMEKKATEDNRVCVINHANPAGFGGAFWSGAAQAQMELVTLLPGDNENDPWETLRYVDLLNQVDLVIPYIFNFNVRPWSRRSLSKLFTLIINCTFSTNLKYTNGTIIYRTSVLQKLISQNHGFFFQTDIIIRLLRAGYLYAEVPQRLNLRKGGTSKAMTLTSLKGIVLGYLKLLKHKDEIVGHKRPENSITETRLRNGPSKFEN